MTGEKSQKTTLEHLRKTCYLELINLTGVKISIRTVKVKRKKRLSTKCQNKSTVQMLKLTVCKRIN
jgi:hypothetical protein